MSGHHTILQNLTYDINFSKQLAKDHAQDRAVAKMLEPLGVATTSSAQFYPETNADLAQASGVYRTQKMKDLAVHAVSHYPVSGLNSLFYRERTGNFADLGRFRPFSCILMLPHQYLTGDFPKEINREFFIPFRE
jgi:hypothetical protein